MKNMPLALTLAIATTFAAPAFAADVVPCEDMLKNVQEALATASLSDADKAKETELENKGIERCAADDDEHADAFFTEALKIMGK